MQNKLIIIENLELNNTSTNLKIEETLLSLVKEFPYILRFWINDPSVIMGRFQELKYEVNQEYTFLHNIPVYRRFSGGGTVYHDHGTLNISLFKRKDKQTIKSSPFNNFATDVISNSLENLGFKTWKNNRNALFINNKKILGSAAYTNEHVFLYHASLLVNTNLNHLTGTILSNPNYNDSSSKPFVKSVRSPVVNLKDFKKDISINQIKNIITENLCVDLSVTSIKKISTYNQLSKLIKLNKDSSNFSNNQE